MDTGGTVNRTMGIFRAIIFEEGENPPDMPLYVLIEFDEYNGPYIHDKLFPIIPVPVSRSYHGKHYTRKQLSQTVSYAISIHKCRDLTIKKAIVDIGERERVCKWFSICCIITRKATA